MDTQKTGDYLAALRKAKGLTQQEIADRLGVSNKTISKWESGGGFPDITVLPALAELYGVTADEILAGEARAVAAMESGHSEVGSYLARRGELRFRLGAAVSAMCLLAAAYFRLNGWMKLLMIGAVLALWVGWGPCSRARLAERFRMVLPLAAMLVYLLLWRFGPWDWLGDMVREWETGYFQMFRWAKGRVTWTVWQLLLPVVYVLVRAVSRSWSGEEHLLDRRSFRVVAAGWAASLAADIARWAVEIPKLLVYLEADSQKWTERNGDWVKIYPKEEAGVALVRAFNMGEKIAQAIILLTLLALALLWLKRHAPAKTED